MKKILIVDDEMLIRYSLSATFRETDREVVSAATGAEALRAIDGNHFDACLLDIHLPDMSGLDIMKKVRAVAPDTKIVIMTGSEVGESMMNSIRENAHLLVTKPFDLDEVKSFVERLVAGGPGHPDWSREAKQKASYVKWIAGDNRKNERRSVLRSVAYSAVPQKGTEASPVLTADVLDISDGGMRIRTEGRLDPGDSISIFDKPALCKGVVRWSANAGAAQSYYAGIQFLPPEGPVL